MRNPNNLTYLDKAKERRDKLRDAGICINGKTHGPATHGALCERCRDVHRYGKAGADARATEQAGELGDVT